MELTQFLARKILMRGNHSGKDVVVAWSSQCKTAHKDIRAYLESNQKEPDTKLLLNAIDATSIDIIYLHTDVRFALSLRRFPELCQKTSFCTDLHWTIGIDFT